MGKTLQTIAYLGWMQFEQRIPGPHLIIVPLSVLSNWMSEFQRFLPAMRVIKLHSSDREERERLKRVILGSVNAAYDVVVTTYDMAKAKNMQHMLVSGVHWRTVVLDEGHIVRNENSIIATTVRKLHFQQALLLTGTPLQNNLHELWSLLNFLMPDVFKSSEKFDKAFNIKDHHNHHVDQALLLKAHAMLKPFMLRRIKADVERCVPPKIEKKILCPLSALQALWYKRFLLKDNELLDQLELSHTHALSVSIDSEQKSSRWKKLQMLLMQLRKVCNHPYLFDEADPNPQSTDESIVEASGKMKVLDMLLRKLQAAGHRVVIFSQFTRVLDILTDYMLHRDFRFCRLDGSTNRVQRQIDINSFNRPGSDLFAFLMSTRAGGLGVNLQTADTVILFDSDWNPQADLQAMARVHRIGQKSIVHVYRLVTEGTVEERVVQRAEKKLYLDQMVNRDSLKSAADVGSEDIENLSASELLDTLRFGANEICSTTSSRELSDSDLDEIVSRQENSI